MNTALAILAHATRMLVFETATTVRVLLPALALVIGCSLFIAVFAGDTVALMSANPENLITPDPTSALVFLIFGLIALLGYALMAILWHRHVLLNGAEMPQEMRPSTGVFLSYLWRAIIVGLVQLLAAVPVVIVMAILGAVFVPQNTTSLSATLIGLLGSMIFVWFALRFSVVLPAAALGRLMTVGQSWLLTRSLAPALWGVAVLLTGLNMFVQSVLLGVAPNSVVPATLLHVIVFIVEGLIFISVLTTLYGHLVEGRSLGQD